MKEKEIELATDYRHRENRNVIPMGKLSKWGIRVLYVFCINRVHDLHIKGMIFINLYD